ncbi:MAG: ribokinase, partial [Oscillochloris sp.]|nr:ribokinase [Oscillochloris sp.]
MIVVVGSLNMDLVIRAPRLPQPGETIAGGPFGTYPGGKGANQAVAAARLGAATAMIGCVGDDDFGRALLHSLHENGVRSEMVQIVAGPSGTALITVEARGQNTIVIAPGANFMLDPQKIDAAAGLLAQARILLLQLETPLAASIRAAEQARAAGTTVILNPAPAPGEPLPQELLRLVDYLTPNEGEAIALLGGNAPDTPPAMAAALRRQLGVPAAIVTLGERGAILADAAGITAQPAFPVTAIDTTAAGDAFIGGFAAALLQG